MTEEVKSGKQAAEEPAPIRKKSLQELPNWKFDANRHDRRRKKDNRFRFEFEGFWYPEPVGGTTTITSGLTGLAAARDKKSCLSEAFAPFANLSVEVESTPTLVVDLVKPSAFRSTRGLDAS